MKKRANPAQISASIFHSMCESFSSFHVAEDCFKQGDVSRFKCFLVLFLPLDFNGNSVLIERMGLFLKCFVAKNVQIRVCNMHVSLWI